MSRTVLFAGGPLHGQTMTVDGHRVVALEPPEILTFEAYVAGDLLPEARQVVYSVSRFALCGRIVWVGHLGTSPDDNLVFDVLISDGAKAASEILTPPPPILPGRPAAGRAAGPAPGA